MDTKQGTKVAKNFCRRKPWGKGFQYFDESGKKVVCKKLLKQFKSLAIPPMWKEVEVCIDANYKIQAVGRDAKNRKQYIYAQQWQAKRQTEKFEKLTEFAQLLPKIRARCDDLLEKDPEAKSGVLALMVKVLDETGIRVGNRQYTKLNGTHGLTTLRRKHVHENDDTMMFEFVGKSNKLRQVSIDDEQLQGHIKSLAESPGYDIFRYKDAQGKWQSISSDDLNQFLQKEFGNEISAKDFRTFNGTCRAVEAYYQIDDSQVNKRTKPENLVIKSVAQHLGNTEAICREYYIHPTVLKKIVDGNMPTYSEAKATEKSRRKNAGDNKVSQTASLQPIEALTLDIISA